ncbi:Protein T20D4.7 [Aphelenchoides avenae]|nr:Protein T20D4.7 [Aphelenchus avenae]
MWYDDLILSRSDGSIVSPAQVLAGQIVGLYFSAGWSATCRHFTPKLKEFYEVAKCTTNFEVGSTVREYVKEYHGDWLHVPHGTKTPIKKRLVGVTISEKLYLISEVLSKRYDVQGIPTLVVFDEDGTIITYDAVPDIMEKPAEVVAKEWRSKKSKKR